MNKNLAYNKWVNWESYLSYLVEDFSSETKTPGCIQDMLLKPMKWISYIFKIWIDNWKSVIPELI